MLNAIRVMTLLLVVTAVGALAVDPPTPPPVRHPGRGHAAPGRVIIQDRERLQRLTRPHTSPVGVAPTHRQHGHHWRWHASYGWVFLPMTVSPGVVVLPPTYVLPPQVIHYEVVAPAPAPACVCPHCGRPVVLTPGG